MTKKKRSTISKNKIGKKRTNFRNESNRIFLFESLSLKRDLITSYWHRTIGDDVSPTLRDFARFWDENMMKTTHLVYRVNCQTVSEYIVIRESLW